MRVTLAEHGGWAAPLRLSRPHPPLAMDTDTLDPSAAGELCRLAAAAMSAAAPRVPPRPAPDGQSYTITIEDAGQTAVLRQSDAAMSDEFAALLEYLKAHA